MRRFTLHGGESRVRMPTVGRLRHATLRWAIPWLSIVDVMFAVIDAQS